MPSIEIICVGQEAPSTFGDLPFAVVAEAELISHRSPNPLFQPDFDALRGCIYHLGNPDLRGSERRYFTAYDLIVSDHDDWLECLKFQPQFQTSLEGLLTTLIEASPLSELLFTSDWQCCELDAVHMAPLTLSEFWSIHERDALRWHAAYPIHGLE